MSPRSQAGLLLQPCRLFKRGNRVVGHRKPSSNAPLAAMLPSPPLSVPRHVIARVRRAWQSERVAVGRNQRRIEREPRVAEHFAEPVVDVALDLLEILEIAWHDCYGDVTPPEDIIDDVLLLSQGDLAGLVRSSRLALVDWRDVKVNAAALRSHPETS